MGSAIKSLPSNREVRTTMKWIDVNKRLPETHESVLFYTKYNVIEKGFLVFEQGHKPIKWNCYNDFHGQQRVELKDVTHWMPLPQPPIEGSR
jgi:hypothetical protein